MKKLKILMVAGAATMLSSCDLSQIPGLDGKLSIEDSKAVGAACRHSGRALEDCFVMNPKTHPAGVFDGWRDMNDYMLANEIEVVKPEVRNSAYKQDEPSGKEGAGHSSASDAEVSAGSPSGSSAESAPPVAGRQRWTPKGASEPSAQAPSAPVQAPAKDAVELVPDKEKPDTANAPATEAPARPWERKKDPKKHT